MTLTTLKRFGTSPLEKEKLNNISRGLDMTGLSFFSILTGMLEGPTALLSFILEISSSISNDVAGKM